jgi:hypothetical protein
MSPDERHLQQCVWNAPGFPQINFKRLADFQSPQNTTLSTTNLRISASLIALKTTLLSRNFAKPPEKTTPKKLKESAETPPAN